MTNGSPVAANKTLIGIPTGLNLLPDSPFKAKNSLVHHPMFEHQRIKRLLRTLPREFVEIRAVQTVATNDGTYLRGEMLKNADPVASFERLEEQPTWILLHKTWIYDADYRQLLNEYLGELSEQSEEIARGISDFGCWMFLSSGKSLIHFHCDSDQSFLNQIWGSKTIFVYPTRILPECVLEWTVHTGEQGQTYNPEYEAQMFPPVELNPGESVFLPLYAPHRVINDDSICISWNVGFHTRRSTRRTKIHLINRELRSLGVCRR